MPDTRQLLNNLLSECAKCSTDFYDNVALIVDDDGNLTDEQVEAIMVDLHDKHVQHVH